MGSVLFTPLERRVQTAAVALVLSVPLVIFAIYVAMAIFAPVTLPIWLLFATWSWYDRDTKRIGRTWPWLRQCALWRHFAAFFPMRLEVTESLEEGVPHVIGLHPHGIISLSAWGNLASQCDGRREALGVDVRIATVWHNFLPPLWRDFLLAMGFVDASRPTFDTVLSRGGAMAVVVGGAAEALVTESRGQTCDLVLDRRKGFVDIALAHGARLVPAFSFGEADMYNIMVFPEDSFARKLQDRLKSAIGISTPLFWGRGIFTYRFGALPNRGPVTTVFGPPLKLPHIPEKSKRTRAVVAEWHAAYTRALMALHEKHRSRFDAPPLRIVE